MAKSDVKALEAIARFQAANPTCADCTAVSPTWVALPHGAAVCIACSGAHRGLGVDVTFVQSLTLDKWTVEAVESLQGNRAVNEQLEYHVPAEHPKPVEGSPAEERKRYITAKYKEKLFLKADGKEPKPPVFATTNGEAKSAARDPGMVVTAGILQIELKHGKALKKMDLLSASDPFCVFSTAGGRQTVKSKVIQNSLNPVWNQRLSVCLERLSDPVELNVFDEDPGNRTDFMGKATIDTSSLKPNEPQEVTVALSTKGTITMVLTLVPLDA